MNICTRLRQRWINFSTQDIIWKNMTRRCPSEADFTAEASQQWPEKELKHRRLLQNQAWPLQTEKFKIAILFKKSPQFFKISFTALFGLEHKNNYLKSVIKNHLLTRQKCATSAVRLTWKRFADRQSYGNFWRSIYSSESPILSHTNAVTHPRQNYT